MSGPGLPRGLLVVVPARDEEARLPRCLATVHEAVRALRTARPEIRTAVVVAADRCSDRTASVAGAAGARVVEVDVGCVGAARRAGVGAGVELFPELPSDEIWIASTDADTCVPPGWLVQQVGLAGIGIGLVIGRAVPERSELDPNIWRRWQERHTSTTLGAHVHGANLGFRYSDYCAVGGWPRLVQHEDWALVEALVAAGVPSAAGLEVVTSARLTGRVPGGFSGFLRTLVRAASPEDMWGAEKTRP